MEFIEMTKTDSKELLNQQMRCVVRAALMVKGMTKKSIAVGIGKSSSSFCKWARGVTCYHETILQTLLDYFIFNYAEDINIIIQLAEELFQHEQQEV